MQAEGGSGQTTAAGCVAGPDPRGDCGEGVAGVDKAAGLVQQRQPRGLGEGGLFGGWCVYVCVCG